MTLWLTAAVAAVLFVFARPRPDSQRLAELGIASRPDPALRSPDGRSIGPAEFAVAVGVGSALVALHLPLVIAMAGGVVPLGWRFVRVRRHRNRSSEEREAAVAEATFALAGELRAGRTASEALRAAATTAGALGDVFRAAADAVAVGGSAAVELEVASGLPGAGRLRAVAAAWRVTESAGGRVALVLERLSEAMDRDDQLRREMAAALAAPRATMMLLAGLPIFGLVLGQAIGAHPLHLLLYRPLGWGLMLGAVLLDAIGVVLTQRISHWALNG